MFRVVVLPEETFSLHPIYKSFMPLTGFSLMNPQNPRSMMRPLPCLIVGMTYSWYLISQAHLLSLFLSSYGAVLWFLCVINTVECLFISGQIIKLLVSIVNLMRTRGLVTCCLTTVQLTVTLRHL